MTFYKGFESSVNRSLDGKTLVASFVSMFALQKNWRRKLFWVDFKVRSQKDKRSTMVTSQNFWEISKNSTKCHNRSRKNKKLAAFRQQFLKMLSVHSNLVQTFSLPVVSVENQEKPSDQNDFNKLEVSCSHQISSIPWTIGTYLESTTAGVGRDCSTKVRGPVCHWKVLSLNPTRCWVYSFFFPFWVFLTMRRV